MTGVGKEGGNGLGYKTCHALLGEPGHLGGEGVVGGDIKEKGEEDLERGEVGTLAESPGIGCLTGGRGEEPKHCLDRPIHRLVDQGGEHNLHLPLLLLRDGGVYRDLRGDGDRDQFLILCNSSHLGFVEDSSGGGEGGGGGGEVGGDGGDCGGVVGTVGE